ncbi:MAG: lytic transglycosylase domain-containing protein [Nocardioides sp.]
MSKHAAARRRSRSTPILGALAAATAGLAILAGTTAGGSTSHADAGFVAAAASVDVSQVLEKRGENVSRSARRSAVTQAKATDLTGLSSDASAMTMRTNIGVSDPKAAAAAMLSDYGWSGSQFGCLDALWERESGWNPAAHNSSSGAHGIPQSLPGSKMASAGADWATNPITQITWGLGYIQARYGSPCGAWAHSEAIGWY